VTDSDGPSQPTQRGVLVLPLGQEHLLQGTTDDPIRLPLLNGPQQHTKCVSATAPALAPPGPPVAEWSRACYGVGLVLAHGAKQAELTQIYASAPVGGHVTTARRDRSLSCVLVHRASRLYDVLKIL
jgi:hypothetical protein